MPTTEETTKSLLPRRFTPIFLAVTAVAFFYIVTDRNGRLLAPQDMGAFYDHLAISMVEGRLDVPLEAIGPEAFIIDGKFYGYWAPFPALLRLPLVVLPESAWVGKTARIYNWLGAMLCAGLMIGVVRQLSQILDLRGKNTPWFLAAFIVAAVWGGHIPYLLAGPSVYHEADPGRLVRRCRSLNPSDTGFWCFDWRRPARGRRRDQSLSGLRSIDGANQAEPCRGLGGHRRAPAVCL